MKKVLSALLIVSVVALAACGGKKSDMLIGSWKLADMNAPAPKEVPDSLKAKYESQMKAQVEEMKKSTTFDFNKDGSFVVKMAGQENKGTWKLSEDGSKLTMSQNGKDDVSNIAELTSNKCVFEVEQNGTKSKVTLAK